MALPPGPLHRDPPPGLLKVFQLRQGVVTEPWSNEHGRFVSGMHPLPDMRRDEPAVVIRVDREAGGWEAAVARARLVPVLYTLAVMSVMLAGLGLLAWRRRLPADRRWQLRHVEAGLCAMIGAAISLAVAWQVNLAGRAHRWDTFTSLARSEAGGVADSLRNLRTQLEAMGSFFESSQEVDAGEFHTYTRPLAGNRLVRAWGWVPVVPLEAMAQVEARARQMGISGFEIHGRDADGRRVPPDGRGVCYPLFHVEPREGNEAAIGFDMGSVPARLAVIEQVARTGLPKALDTGLLDEKGGGEQGLLVFQPVRAQDGGRSWLRGFVVMALRLGAVLQRPYDGSGDEGLDIALYELEAGRPPRLVGSEAAEAARRNGVAGHALSGGERLSMALPLFIFNRSYAMEVGAVADRLAPAPLWQGWIAGGAGLLLTALLAGFVTVIINRRARLERAVLQRTAELRRSEESYRRQFSENSAIMLLINIDDGRIIEANEAAVRYYGHPRERLLAMRITDISARNAAAVRASISGVPATHGSRFESRTRLADGSVRDVEVFASRILFGEREVLHVIVVDIAERRRAEAALAAKICELQDAMGQIKTLRGILPICSCCKKIRDDAGYWRQVDAYVSAHSDAQFSHGICPECAAKLYPSYTPKSDPGNAVK